MPAAERRMEGDAAFAPPAPARPSGSGGKRAAVPALKRLRRQLRGLGIRLLLLLLRLLPLRVARALGRSLGGVAYHLFGKDRRLALAHLERAMPELTAAGRVAIVKRMFRSFGDGGAEIALAHRLHGKRLEEWVLVPPEAEAVLREALAAGKGVVAVTGHVGNWELLFRRFARGGYTAFAVGKEPGDPGLAGIVERIRGPGLTIWRGAEGAAKQLLRALRGNALLAILIDQDTRVQGVFVPFFGELAFTPRAAADLSVRTGAAAVAVFIHRRPDGGHVVSASRIPGQPAADREAEVVALTAAMTAAIEAEIRRVPHEWVWMHRRWKTRPPA